ncbi:hypothetical protein N0B31_20140 [Salinirubellus salinus]|uniref:Uncharacterized protein n=1 Tax=Salinirubellus salinus TaxID=1364945 RepID=A0A9E7R2K8_9EURY|nr:rod-determining factor RdfA [Salinirubellus salinus]UWM54416.1 hypothetical protein N0B31_20140 [Salinirubellus salinus]
MTTENTSESDAGGRRVKVARLIDEYGLEGLGGELERRWTAEDDSRLSLRALANHFNRRLLSDTISRAGVRALDGDADSIYRVLTEDDPSGADATRTRRRLEREGIDVDTLLDDFVSYQAIRTYLTEYRDAEYTRSERDRVEAEKESLQRLRGRTSAVTESKLEQLRAGDHLTLGEFRTIVSTSVVCEDCGGQYEVVELLDRGGCDCE